MSRQKKFNQASRDYVLSKYFKVVNVDSRRARDLVKGLNYQKDPYLLQCIALTYFDESRLNADSSLREYFDMKKLRLSEKYIIKAYILNERCIDVLYTLGKIRNGFHQTDLAIYCFRKIIEIGSRKIPKRDTCSNRDFIKIKVNDSRFQLYRLYHDKGEYNLARRYLSIYKKGLEKGIGTIFKPIESYLMG